MLSTDISDALEKVVEHLDNSVADNPSVFIKSNKPFGMRMRLHKYIKAFKIQMEHKEDVNEKKYDHLNINSNVEGVMITSALEKESLALTDEEGKRL